MLRAAAEGRPKLLGSLDIADHLLDGVGDQELTLGRLARLPSDLQVTLIITTKLLFKMQSDLVSLSLISQTLRGEGQ